MFNSLLLAFSLLTGVFSASTAPSTEIVAKPTLEQNISKRKTIEDYFKLILKASPSSVKDATYKVLEMDSENDYMKLLLTVNGKLYVAEYHLWRLGLGLDDSDSDGVLLGEVVYTGGYSTLPSFYRYKNDKVDLLKSKDMYSNYDVMIEYIAAHEKMTTGDEECCDLRVLLPKKGDNIEVVTVNNEVAKKLTDRPDKSYRKIAELTYDFIMEQFTFEFK